MSKKAQVAIFIIIAIILIAGIILVFLVSQSKSDVEINAECQTDADCVKVQTTCCSCAMGGEEKCIPKLEENLYKRQLESCPDNQICIALYNCKIENCLCVEGKCIEK